MYMYTLTKYATFDVFPLFSLFKSSSNTSLLWNMASLHISKTSQYILHTLICDTTQIDKYGFHHSIHQTSLQQPTYEVIQLCLIIKAYTNKTSIYLPISNVHVTTLNLDLPALSFHLLLFFRYFRLCC